MKGLSMSLVLVACWLGTLSGASAGEPVTVTVQAKGVHCDQCVTAVREALGKVKGIRFDPEKITVGERPRFVSEPFTVEIADYDEVSLGALGRAVATAAAPHGDDIELRLHLILYTQRAVDEDSVSSLRSVLADVNGLIVNEPGSLGGAPRKGYFWVQIEPAGGADLKLALAGAKLAVPVTLTPEQ